MDFGRIAYDGLTEENFQFARVKQIVLPGHKVADPGINIGLEKWGRSEWVGSFYPPKTKENQFLNYYVKHFDSIEFNATHYRVQGKDTVQGWIDRLGEKDFIFCPKMYQGITHRGSLQGKDFITAEFFRSMDHFGKHLGPIFIQVSEKFSYKRISELVEFLEKLPKAYTYFLEIRHEQWFANNTYVEDLCVKLRELKVGFIITDTPGRRDVVHMNLTIPKAFIRFCCWGDEELDKYRIQQWKEQLKTWYDKGLEHCYFFLHIYRPPAAPEFSMYVKEQFADLIKTKNV